MPEPSPDVHDELFELRLERWRPDCEAGLRSVYRPEEVAPLLASVERVLRQVHAARRPSLRRLDQQRLLRPDWFQRPEVLGYAAYTERFAGDLAGVEDALDYLQELGVTYLHLLPLLRRAPVTATAGTPWPTTAGSARTWAATTTWPAWPTPCTRAA